MSYDRHHWKPKIEYRKRAEHPIYEGKKKIGDTLPKKKENRRHGQSTR